MKMKVIIRKDEKGRTVVRLDGCLAVWTETRKGRREPRGTQIPGEEWTYAKDTDEVELEVRKYAASIIPPPRDPVGPVDGPHVARDPNHDPDEEGR